MPTTRSRPHGREHARSSAGGTAAEHATKIYAVATAGIVIVVAFLALTSIGHVIDAATQHFMLFYAGVFALIALCASTGLGLVATDRVFLTAGHRVLAQSAHRAASFGAVTFLIIHIVTELLAQRVHVLDAVVPFLSPFRTFYIGLGTIASDLVILLVITGIMRGRFNAHGRAWRWRAIHYTSYASFVFGVWHGLLAGRPAKPYVDWSYGFLVALVLLALVVRIVANSLRPKESLSGPPVPMSGDSASAPMRAAAMFAQLGASRADTGGQPRLMISSVQESVLSGPASGGYPDSPMLTAPVPAGTGELYYEPGYEGPPRYIGTPRANSGPMPRAATGSQPRLPTGPFPTASTGPMAAAGGTPSWPSSGHPSGPMPRAATGPFPRAGGLGPGHPSGPMPRAATGPFPTMPPGAIDGAQSWPSFRPMTGPMPQAADPGWPGDGGRWPDTWPESGPVASPRPGRDAGAHARPLVGPSPRPRTGPMPAAGPASGPMPRATGSRRTWPSSGPASGPMPQADRGPRSAPWPGSPGTGPMPQAGSGSGRRGGSRPQPRGGDWPNAGQPSRRRPQAASGPMPAAGPSPGDHGPQPYYQPQDDYPGQPGYPPPSGGRAPWDGGLPEPDPAFKYREPGPGMPGYRGSRDARYGGDRRG